MSLQATVFNASDQELIPDVRPEDIPNTNPFDKDVEEEDRQSDEEVWDEEDEEDGEEE